MTIPESPSADVAPPSGFPAEPLDAPAFGTVTPFPQRAPPVEHRTSAFQTVAWRAPTATRFDGRPANDFLTRAEAVVPFRTWRAPAQDQQNGPAGWFTFAVGACIAALLGALIGGLMSV